MAIPSPNQHLPRQVNFYTPFFLHIYDIIVLQVSCPIFWKCRTKDILYLFRKHVGPRHLDIGVGSGYFLEYAGLPNNQELTLCDLNPNCLEKAKARLGRSDINTFQLDILCPLPSSLGVYDSISINYVIHCLPVPMSQKLRVFENIKDHLTPDGVIFGSTVLGPSAFGRFSFGKAALWLYNWLGGLANWNDTEEEIVAYLEKHFTNVETKKVGRVLTFVLSRPL